ncbi:MAG: energy-coupling factor ABC transporter ATP-binding protein [Deltaproteobacteria bacterium]|jgi:cobalt/nickel transport system ATP-binding protein|nr:energy-coupling factor ABC transporter ATP-binding protein [Deltaproteobacteria bacterium]
MVSDNLIELKEISFSYPGGRKIFEDLSFNFPKGAKLGLIGANGSGKTTLLHLIMGLIQRSKGEIRLFGEPCEKESEFRKARLKIGFVFQDANDQLFCPTVKDDIAFGPLNMGRSQKETDKIVEETLELLNLMDFRDRVTYALSDGEKKLISIGTALAMLPEMLILDEPTTCLDENAVERVVQVLTDCNLPYLVVTHDKQFLERVVTSRVKLDNSTITRMPAY